MLFVTALDEMVQTHILNVLAFLLEEHFCILSKLAQMFWSSGTVYVNEHQSLLSVTIRTADLIDLGGLK